MFIPRRADGEVADEVFAYLLTSLPESAAATQGAALVSHRPLLLGLGTRLETFP